jgi:prevent-host-death family protein
MTPHPAPLKSEVGVRELHDRLSRYVQHVKDGAEVVVTMRGRRVARLVPAHLPRGARRARRGSSRTSHRRTNSQRCHLQGHDVLLATWDNVPLATGRLIANDTP